MKNFIQEGDRITWTNSGSAVASGDPVIINGRAFVACVDIANGETGSLATEGVFEFPKETGKSFALVDDVFWDAVAGKCTSDKDATAAAAVAGTNTGNGTVTAQAPGTSAISEIWTMTCTGTATNGGTFSVVGSKTGRMADAVVGTPYTNGFVGFTINDGTTDFSAGDSFTIAVTGGNTRIGFATDAADSSATLARVMVDAVYK